MCIKLSQTVAIAEKLYFLMPCGVQFLGNIMAFNIFFSTNKSATGFLEFFSVLNNVNDSKSLLWSV